MLPLPDTYGTEILRSTVGSTLFGTSLTAVSDRDEMGIFVEHPESTIGLKKRDHYTTRTAADGERSGDDDTDLAVYSLRKWVALALNGNPTVLLPLFAPDNLLILSSPYGFDLRQHIDWFASRRSGNAFLGYMEQQRQRLTGDRGRAGRLRSRGDCPVCLGEGMVAYGTDEHGGEEKCRECGGSGLLVDWKYAMHLLRLGHQGVEYLETGRLILPIPDPLAEHLRSVRRGEVPMTALLLEAESLEEKVKLLMDGKSPLPDEPDADAIQEWMIDTHLEIWKDLGELYGSKKLSTDRALQSVPSQGDR